MAQLLPKDWTLLAIAFSRGQPLTPVQLQKSLFLLGNKLRSEVGADYYAFVPYDYGPFSKQIYVDAEDLGNDGLVAFVPHPGGSWLDYVATPAGTKKASDLRKQTSQKAIDYLAKLVKWTSERSFPELVKWVYVNYPEYKVNSIFGD